MPQNLQPARIAQTLASLRTLFHAPQALSWGGQRTEDP